MTNPSWNTVPVHGVFTLPGGGFERGSIEFNIPSTINITDNSINRGRTIKVYLHDGEVSVDLPAMDDPDIGPEGLPIKVVERFVSGRGRKYTITPSLTMLPTGIDLTDVVVPPDGEAPASLVRGVPNGVAGLNASGQVIDAYGNVVHGVVVRAVGVPLDDIPPGTVVFRS